MDAQTASEILKTLREIEANTLVTGVVIWLWFLVWFLWGRK